MARSESNSPAVIRAVAGLADALNLRRRTEMGQRLGDELIDTAALVIEDRTVNRQQDSRGRQLKPLKHRTVKRKREAGLDPRILVETHTMLDIDQIRGRTSVTANTAVTLAGIDEETQKKVEWAEEGDMRPTKEGGPIRAKRPFEDLGKDGEAAIDSVIDETIDAAARKAYG